MKLLLVILGALLVGGCATRGALQVDCGSFASVRHTPIPSKLQQAITGSGASLSVPGSQPIREHLEGLLTAPALSAGLTAGSQQDRAVLLLSGGGQWGAFGAAYLKQLHATGRLPDFPVVTGVSTGALQALFVAIGDDAAYEQLIRNYSPAREKDVVNRNSKPLAAITGSFAGLKPLQYRIEQAICPNPTGGQPCLLDRIKALRQANKMVLIGFVEAASGSFHYIDAVEVANLPDRAKARSCLAGAALASAAMPVFFQQVRVDKKAYYDGGVRQSVFEAGIATEVEAAAVAALARGFATSPSAIPGQPDRGVLPIYIVRNGPTALKPADATNRKADALTAAERAEAVVVNELEVGSIAAIRLAHPTGAIRLITADGYQRDGGCSKKDEIMFDPNFMECLRTYGASLAGSSSDPWITLPPLKIETTATAVRP